MNAPQRIAGCSVHLTTAEVVAWVAQLLRDKHPAAAADYAATLDEAARRIEAADALSLAMATAAAMRDLPPWLTVPHA